MKKESSIIVSYIDAAVNQTDAYKIQNKTHIDTYNAYKNYRQYDSQILIILHAQ